MKASVQAEISVISPRRSNQRPADIELPRFLCYVGLALNDTKNNVER